MNKIRLFVTDQMRAVPATQLVPFRATSSPRGLGGVYHGMSSTNSSAIAVCQTVMSHLPFQAQRNRPS